MLQTTAQGSFSAKSSRLNHHLTKHINRFGSYSLDLNRKPPALDFEFSLIPS